ncbi:MAG TPA: hypothetical protein VM100_14275 [Longimicrobiales bacterium]|nr:hypothetical protein [Longimicrobiales bacterium]
MSTATNLTEFLFPAPAPRRTAAIFVWWEKRRLPFNAVVGGFGLFSWAFTTILAAMVREHPIPWQGPIIFGVLANLWYTTGPLAEMALHRLFGRSLLPMGPALYRMGLTFSVGLTLLPMFMYSMMIVAKTIAFILP